MAIKYNDFMAGTALVLVFLSPCVFADARADKLKNMQEAFARMDREDFLEGIEVAGECTQQRDFACADKALSEVKELADSESETKLWKMATANLAAEKQRVAEESRQREDEYAREQREEARRIAAAEAEERRQQRAHEEEERRRAIQFGLNSLGIAVAGKNLDSQQLNTLLEANARDYQQGGDGSNFQSSLNQMKADSERRGQENMQRLHEQQSQRQREQDDLRRAMAEQRSTRVNAQAAPQAASAMSASIPAGPSQAQRQQQAEKARLEREVQRAAEIKQQEEVAALAEQERQKKRAQEKAEREVKRAAERAEEERAKQEYLQQVARGVKLGAMKCYGEYHLRGTRPNIKPELVGCVDVHYRLRCSSSNTVFGQGVARNFVGMDAGCFGDTYQISKPACPVESVVVEVEKATPCER